MTQLSWSEMKDVHLPPLSSGFGSLPDGLPLGRGPSGLPLGRGPSGFGRFPSPSRPSVNKRSFRII